MNQLPITATEVERMRLEAKKSGNPSKLADYSIARQAYRRMTSTYFNDEFPYAQSPNAEYVEELKKMAESGDSDAKARYLIVKERFELNERVSSGDDMRNMRQTQYHLRKLLEEGGPVTNKHIEAAGDLAVKNTSLDNMVVYAGLKQRQREQQVKDS